MKYEGPRTITLKDGAITHLQDLPENIFLHLRIVHPDRPAPNLDPIEDKIIMLPTNVLDAARIHFLDVLVHGRGERVVRAAPATVRKEFLVCVRTREERELGYPKEFGCAVVFKAVLALCVLG